MIELSDRSRSDDILSTIFYSLLAVHAVTLFTYVNVFLSRLPGGEITFYAWIGLTFFGVAVALAGVVLRSLELERAGVVPLIAYALTYGLSGLFVLNTVYYPGPSSTIQSFAIMVILALRYLAIGREIRSLRRVVKVAEKNQALKDDLTGGSNK